MRFLLGLIFWAGVAAAQASTETVPTGIDDPLFEMRLNVVYLIIFSVVGSSAFLASLLFCYCKFRNACGRHLGSTRPPLLPDQHIDAITHDLFIGMTVPSTETAEVITGQTLRHWLCCQRRARAPPTRPAVLPLYVDGHILAAV